jgi:hypothetical protein
MVGLTVPGRVRSTGCVSRWVATAQSPHLDPEDWVKIMKKTTVKAPRPCISCGRPCEDATRKVYTCMDCILAMTRSTGHQVEVVDGLGRCRTHGCDLWTNWHCPGGVARGCSDHPDDPQPRRGDPRQGSGFLVTCEECCEINGVDPLSPEEWTAGAAREVLIRALHPDWFPEDICPLEDDYRPDTDRQVLDHPTSGEAATWLKSRLAPGDHVDRVMSEVGSTPIIEVEFWSPNEWGLALGRAAR